MTVASNENMRSGSEKPVFSVGTALKSCRTGFIAVAIFSMFMNLLMLTAPLYMIQVYDRVLSSRSVDTLLYLTLIVIFALAILGFIDLARGRVMASIGTWLDHRLSPQIFERALQGRLRGRSYGPEAVGDLSVIRSFVSSPGAMALFDLPWTLIFVAAAYTLHPYFGHLAVASAVLLLVLTTIGEYATRDAIRNVGEVGMRARRDLEASSRNAEVVEAMGMRSALARRWAERNGEMLELQTLILRRSTLLSSLTKFVRLAVQSLGLGLGAWLVLQQEVTPGAIIAASILLSRALAPIEQGIGAWKSIVSVRAAVARLKPFTTEKAYRPEAMPLPMPKGEVSCENVAFALDPAAPPILRGVSFQIAAGEALAIVGPSGAGKSTLSRILVGAISPVRGVVRIDGADIFSWDRDQVGDFLGYLPQDVELFSGTVAQNIARLRDFKPEAVVEAARMANVHDMIVRLPHGYETELGEGGQQLSGGQRQRIALARAVYGKPRVVVLDEPNSNLDSDGEFALAQAMATMKAAGTTVIVVTHRPALVQHVEKMLLLRDGQVEAFGPRQEVYARLLRPAQPAAGAAAPQPPAAAAAGGAKVQQAGPRNATMPASNQP